MRFQLLAARAGFAFLLLGLATAGLAIAGVRLGFFAYPMGFTLMIPATILAIVAFFCAALWFHAAFKRNKGEGARLGLTALIGSVIFLYPPLSTLYDRLANPAIHDASTDPDDPPQFKTLLKTRSAGMNSPVFNGQAQIHFRGADMTISYALHEYYVDVTKPVRMLMPHSSNPAKTLFWRAFELAKALGWHIVDYSERDGRIEATASSFWFGQVSDIVIRVRPSGFMGARVDARAESRQGAIDDGRNLALLKSFVSRIAP